MSDKEARKKLSIEKLKKTHLVGKGKTEHISTIMGGKTRGFTEHISDVRKVGRATDVMAKNQAIIAAKKAARAARLSKLAGKAAGKVPGIGMVLGPAVTLAVTGNPNEAMASAFDSEALGEGSDKVGDLGLSRADRLKAERRALAARMK